MMSLGAIVCGFLLDLAIGDPHGWPHPIILIGNLISTLEKKVRAVSGTDPGKLLRGGFVLVLIVCVLSFFIPFFDFVWSRNDRSLASVHLGNHYVLPDFLHPFCGTRA